MIRKLEAWISQNEPSRTAEFKNSLNVPASDKALDELEAKVGEKLPAAFRECYLHADGMNVKGGATPWRLLSLSEICRILDAYTGMDVYDDLVTQFAWSRRWLPFAIDMTGDNLCLNLIPQEQLGGDGQPYDLQHSGGVFVYRHAENVVKSYASDLSECIDCWIEDRVELSL